MVDGSVVAMYCSLGKLVGCKGGKHILRNAKQAWGGLLDFFAVHVVGILSLVIIEAAKFLVAFVEVIEHILVAAIG